MQRGAAHKSTASNLFHGIGYADLLQRSTIQEYAVTQRIQLTWQDNALQEFATIKSGAFDQGHGIGKDNALQSRSAESALLDILQCIGKFDLGQRGAVPKCMPPHGCNRIGQRNTFQRGTFSERAVPNSGHGVGDRDALKPFVTVKYVIANAFKAIGNGYLGDGGIVDIQLCGNMQGVCVGLVYGNAHPIRKIPSIVDRSQGVAGPKCEFVDRFYRNGDRDLGQVSTPIERIALDHGHRWRNDNTLQRDTLPKRADAYALHGIRNVKRRE